MKASFKFLLIGCAGVGLLLAVTYRTRPGFELSALGWQLGIRDVAPFLGDAQRGISSAAESVESERIPKYPNQSASPEGSPTSSVLWGRCVDLRAEPLENIRIRTHRAVTTEAPAIPESQFQLSALTDANGGFKIETDATLPLDFMVNGDFGGPISLSASQGTGAFSDGVVLEIPVTLSLRVRLSHVSSRADMWSADVVVRRLDGQSLPGVIGYIASATCTAELAARFFDMMPGDYEVSCDVDGLSLRDSITIHRTDDRHIELHLQVPRVPVYTLRVVDLAGQPRAGFLVQLHSEYVQLTARSDAEGLVQFTNVVPGQYQIRAGPRSARQTNTSPSTIDFKEWHMTTVTARFQSPEVLTVTNPHDLVLELAANNISELDLTAYLLDSAGDAITLAALDRSSVTLSDLAAGDYLVEVKDDHDQVLQRNQVTIGTSPQTKVVIDPILARTDLILPPAFLVESRGDPSYVLLCRTGLDTGPTIGPLPLNNGLDRVPLVVSPGNYSVHVSGSEEWVLGVSALSISLTDTYNEPVALPLQRAATLVVRGGESPRARILLREPTLGTILSRETELVAGEYSFGGLVPGRWRVSLHNIPITESCECDLGIVDLVGGMSVYHELK